MTTILRQWINHKDNKLTPSVTCTKTEDEISNVERLFMGKHNIRVNDVKGKAYFIVEMRRADLETRKPNAHGTYNKTPLRDIRCVKATFLTAEEEFDGYIVWVVNNKSAKNILHITKSEAGILLKENKNKMKYVFLKHEAKISVPC